MLVSGCATIPDLNSVIDGANEKPRIVGARGPLTPKQSKAILAKLESEGRGSDVLERHMALEGAFDESPIVVGNNVTVIKSGSAAFAAIFDAIAGAKHSVNLEYFTIEDIEDQGRHLGDLLAEKVRNGVQVNVIYDSAGSLETPSAFFTGLKDAGVNLVAFNPLNPLDSKHGYSPNDRDHRKILVADGTVAITGGVNLSSVYSSVPFSDKDETKAPPAAWKDTDVKIDGPAVAEFQRLFLATWKEQKGPVLDESGFFPKPETKGSEIVHVVGSGPGHPVPIHYASLLSAIRNAETRIWISAAYFVPTGQEMEDLIAAAHRGVEIKLLLPGKTDSPLALNAGHARFTSLLKNGIEIYETREAVLHSKTTVIDGVWSSIGSSNFDHRSVLYNNEVDVVILGRPTAADLEEIFRTETAQAARIDLAAWKRRPIAARFHEFYARFLKNLL